MSAPATRPDSRTDAALDLLVRGRAHIFLTGRAGTGKTTLVRRFMDMAGEDAAIVAPTGVAAMNAGGQTIHSFFRLPPRLISPGDVKRLRHAKVIRALKTLVIDEISMVRADLMSAIDLSLRLNRGIEEPFGGVRVIAVGDLAQLPPVVQGEVAQYLDEEFGGPFFFNSPAFADAGFLRLELDTVFRQDDPDFIDILSGVRDADLTQSQAARLNQRVSQATGFDASATHVVLTPTNEQAFRINAQRLAALPGRETAFDGAVKGEFDPRLFPTESPLLLKPGARVMMIRNDPGGRFVNGTLGEVESVEGGAVRVRIGEEVVRVDPVDWERVKYVYDEKEKAIGQEVIGAFKQLPLRLAWAMTVHKSQGLTLDRLYVDMGRGMFAHGQAYVALSRARALDGLWLSRALRPSDLVRDPRVDGIRSVTHDAPI